MSTHKTLVELYAEHVGKSTVKWESYLHVYEQILSPYRDKPIRLLEIGVQNGGSLEIWAKYFTRHVHIIGCDINPACHKLKYFDSRTHVLVGDANAPATQEAVRNICPHFDLIIEDGSHRSSDIIKTFCHYLGDLQEGGLFMIEDLHCSYWDEYEGGIHYPYSSMNFFKKLVDIVNYQHWGIPTDPMVILADFVKMYDLQLNQDAFLSIESISFYDSMCVIKKSKRESHRLGARKVAGQEEAVVAGNIDFADLMSEPLTQTANVWALIADGSERSDLPIFLQKIAQQKLMIQSLMDQIASMEREQEGVREQHVQQIAALRQEIEALKRSFLNRATHFLKTRL